MRSGGDLAADLRQVQAGRGYIDMGQDEGGADGSRGADCTEQVGPGVAAIARRPGPGAAARPDPGQSALLTDARHNRHEASYVQVTLTDADRPPHAMERLRTRFPFTLVLAFEPAGGARVHLPRARTSGRSDHDIALDFVADLRGVPASDVESALLRDACDACCEDPDADVRLTGAVTR